MKTQMAKSHLKSFWFSGSWVEPEILHFWHVPSRCWCCWSGHHTLKTTVPVWLRKNSCHLFALLPSRRWFCLTFLVVEPQAVCSVSNSLASDWMGAVWTQPQQLPDGGGWDFGLSTTDGINCVQLWARGSGRKKRGTGLSIPNREPRPCVVAFYSILLYRWCQPGIQKLRCPRKGLQRWSHQQSLGVLREGWSL